MLGGGTKSKQESEVHWWKTGKGIEFGVSAMMAGYGGGGLH